MIFNLNKKNQWYPKYWETKYYAVGVIYELNQRYKIQFLSRIGKDNWEVLGEWASYEWPLISKTIQTIFDRLKDIDDEKPDTIYGTHKHKEIVADFLPEKRSGLLEK